MEIIRFVFWEAIKALALVFLAIIASKAIAVLSVRAGWVKSVLYTLVLAMAGVGAWEVGNDVAAEVYRWSANNNLSRGDVDRAYSNALAAVRMRPNNLDYWRALMQAKIRLNQLQSVLDDEPAMRALSGGDLDEVDEYQFALCSYILGENDRVVATTLRLIRHNPSYAAPYVLQGLAYIAEKKYVEAEQSFLGVLQIFPNNRAAVEGLARAYYLAGDRQRALAVLTEAAKFPFPAPALQRFEALKGLYDQ